MIEETFGSQRAFTQEFMAAAGDQFGSGWAWLVLEDGRLKITATSNAETPIVSEQVALFNLSRALDPAESASPRALKTL